MFKIYQLFLKNFNEKYKFKYNDYLKCLYLKGMRFFFKFRKDFFYRLIKY